MVARILQPWDLNSTYHAPSTIPSHLGMELKTWWKLPPSVFRSNRIALALLHSNADPVGNKFQEDYEIFD